MAASSNKPFIITNLWDFTSEDGSTVTNITSKILLFFHTLQSKIKHRAFIYGMFPETCNS